MPQILELASPWLILCSGDTALAARRQLQRGLEDPRREFYHGDPRVAHYRRTGEVLPPENYAAASFEIPTLRVSTDAEYVPGIEELARRIQS
jgi:hypothetical protein